MSQKPSPAKLFKSLHVEGEPLVMPNLWDAGSAKILQSLGFKALATTSSGFAITLGRSDYQISQTEALSHASDIVKSVSIPVSADLENGFGDSPEAVKDTISKAIDVKLAGGSIEDATGNADTPIYDEAHAVERIIAAVEAKNTTAGGFVLSARAEQFLYGSTDLDGTIARLQKFAAAGADVLYAPGLPDMDSVRAVCSALSKPVNVLLYGALINEPLTAFAKAGVARISIGGGLANCAYADLVRRARGISENANFQNLKSDAADTKAVASAMRPA